MNFHLSQCVVAVFRSRINFLRSEVFEPLSQSSCGLSGALS